MMIGVVTPDLQAVVHLRVRGTRSEEIETVVDTGFNGFLTLSPDVIARLALSFVGTTRVGLGDGRDVEMRYFKAFASWNGVDRAVEVLESDGGALVGMAWIARWKSWNLTAARWLEWRCCTAATSKSKLLTAAPFSLKRFATDQIDAHKIKKCFPIFPTN